MYLKNVISKKIEGPWRKEQDPELDPDPLVRGTDPDPYLPGCHGSETLSTIKGLSIFS
jgi:hypothetical protein